MSAKEVFTDIISMPFTARQIKGYYCWAWIVLFIGLTVLAVFAYGAYNKGSLEAASSKFRDRLIADGTYFGADRDEVAAEYGQRFVAQGAA